MRIQFIKYGIILTLLTIVIVCCKTDNDRPKKNKPIVALKIISPNRSQQYVSGQTIDIELEVIDSNDVKALSIYFDDVLYKKDIAVKSQIITIETDSLGVGFHSVYITYNDKNGKSRGATRNIVLFSDIIPEQKIASIVASYPHKNNAYTQGLEFYKGDLYESTGSGDSNKSFIAKVDLSTGNHLKYKELENISYFGEGITILNDTIYQLTWQDQQCLVYDIDFNYIKSFTYEKEGWGLTNNGRSLIMSNGTSSIVWRNPTTFEIEKKIDVFSDQNDVQNLNELELINGDLWCNVYTSDYLVQVDTASGKVLANIDCSGVSLQGMDRNSNVLNGIAYEANTKKIYLTGKLWPKLFEVKID